MSKLAIGLPAGGQLLAFASLEKQSTDCPAALNLQTQVAPWLASMSCELKILALLKPLIDVVHGLPAPPPQAILAFSKAAVDLAPCFLAGTPAGVVPFVRDLLCLEIRSLNCLLVNLKAVANLGSADPAAVHAVLDSYPPIVGILNLAAGFFQIAGIAVPHAPSLAGGVDPASLAADRNAVAAFTVALQSAADALGGCA